MGFSKVRSSLCPPPLPLVPRRAGKLNAGFGQQLGPALDKWKLLSGSDGRIDKLTGPLYRPSCCCRLMLRCVSPRTFEWCRPLWARKADPVRMPFGLPIREPGLNALLGEHHNVCHAPTHWNMMKRWTEMVPSGLEPKSTYPDFYQISMVSERVSCGDGHDFSTKSEVLLMDGMGNNSEFSHLPLSNRCSAIRCRATWKWPLVSQSVKCYACLWITMAGVEDCTNDTKALFCISSRIRALVSNSTHTSRTLIDVPGLACSVGCNLLCGRQPYYMTTMRTFDNFHIDGVWMSTTNF